MDKKYKEYPNAKVVILCGAHTGEMIPKMTQRYPNATIYAIEPFDKALKSLKEVAAEKNVVIIPKAVWTSSGTKTFRLYESSSANSFYGRPGRKHLETITVETMDLAEFLKEFELVDYLRLNIEGSEYEVLLHCFEQGVMDRVKFLEFECHAHKIPELQLLECRLMEILKTKVPTGFHIIGVKSNGV